MTTEERYLPSAQARQHAAEVLREYEAGARDFTFSGWGAYFDGVWLRVECDLVEVGVYVRRFDGQSHLTPAGEQRYFVTDNGGAVAALRLRTGYMNDAGVVYWRRRRHLRPQDITEEDACAEGMVEGAGGAYSHSARTAYRHGWDLLNGKRSPWVWVVDFRRIP